jgi:hypothetical protein
VNDDSVRVVFQTTMVGAKAARADASQSGTGLVVDS